MLTLLAACEPYADPTTRLPPLPAGLRACLERSGVDVPDRALTAGEVEKSWKTDRRVQAAVRNCGLRIAAWYEDLRRGWK